MQIRNTKDQANSILSYLISGKSKTGKTRLTTTTPEGETLVINVENNLASIYGANVNIVDAFTWPDFMEIVNWLEGLPAKDRPKWIFIDSLTELVKILLKLEKSLTKDPRQAYGEIGIKIPDIVRRLKSLGVNLVCIAQEGYIKDEANGDMHFGATFEGRQLEQSLPSRS